MDNNIVVGVFVAVVAGFLLMNFLKPSSNSSLKSAPSSNNANDAKIVKPKIGGPYKRYLILLMLIICFIQIVICLSNRKDVEPHTTVESRQWIIIDNKVYDITGALHHFASFVCINVSCF